jgi:hypothetical protein
VGAWALAFEGLDEALAGELDRRWGPFAGPAGDGEPDLRIAVAGAAVEVGLGTWSRGERYRMETVQGPGIPRVRSYGFSLASSSERAFELDLVSDVAEPVGRRLDNVARLLVARLALGAGGFALHAAGVLDRGRAHVLAGPSRSGKSTAVASLGWPSLGDDFAVLVPGPRGWLAAAVPFDNAESVPASARTGSWPLASVWRLEQGPRGARRALPPTAAATMLTACTAFPWALPDLAGALLEAVVRCAREVPCGVLTFGPETDLRTLLV